MTPDKKKPSWKKKFAAVALAGAGFCAAGYGLECATAPSPTTVAAAAGLPTTECLGQLTTAFNNGAAAPKGDGHPVLVIPGFLTNDTYMSVLRDRISAQGYAVYGWQAGFDTGPDAAKAQQLAKRLQEIYAENGGQKVSLVGYSLGGVYARELAQKYPDLVRNVVTLGAPLSLTQADGRPDERLRQIHDFYDGPALPAVPFSALFSVHDHISGWRPSLAAAGPQTENIPVEAGHLAMPFSGPVAEAVLNRLAQKPEGWQPLFKTVCPAPAKKSI